MAVDDLSASTQDYLKCIWTLSEWTTGPVSTTALAERLGVRTSSASDGVKKLAEQGLVEHESYGGITLTDAGRAHAVAMVRRHRLLETYLVEQLGYGWDEVHDEAEILEHAVSDRLVAAMDERLGHPTADPHGDPIPAADGAAHLPDAVPLTRAEPGHARIARISDDDPERLRFFASHGITPDVVVTVASAGGASGVAGEPDDVGVGVAGTDVRLSPVDAAAVWVTQESGH